MNGVFVLDTNILIAACAHRNRTVWSAAEREFGVGRPETTLLICVVSVGEFRSFAVQNNWSPKQFRELDAVLRRAATVDINDDDVLAAYVEIDVFSKKNRHGAVSMGKNDLWIAAVAKVVDAPVLTTDGDFDHLHGRLPTRYFIHPSHEVAQGGRCRAEIKQPTAPCVP